MTRPRERGGLPPHVKLPQDRLKLEAAAPALADALREAREHMIGRALCDDSCETLRMVDAALRLAGRL